MLVTHEHTHLHLRQLVADIKHGKHMWVPGGGMCTAQSSQLGWSCGTRADGSRPPPSSLCRMAACLWQGKYLDVPVPMKKKTRPHLHLMELVADVEHGQHVGLPGSCRQLRLHHHSLLQALPQALGAAGGRQGCDGLVQRSLQILQAPGEAGQAHLRGWACLDW